MCNGGCETCCKNSNTAPTDAGNEDPAKALLVAIFSGCGTTCRCDNPDATISLAFPGCCDQGHWTCSHCGNQIEDEDQ